MKKYLFTGAFLLISVFLLFNVVYSQLVSPLYGRVVAGDRQAATEYLKRIKRLPFFSDELSVYKKIYGEGIEKDVFHDDYERKKSITMLETLLKQNSGARDVLYRLYLLYKEDGNERKATQYLKRAKEIDPLIKE